MRRALNLLTLASRFRVGKFSSLSSQCIIRPVTCQVVQESNKIFRVMSSSTERNVDLTYEDILSLKAKKEIQLIDVREHDEIRETGKLPDSVHIPLGEVVDALKGSAEDFQSKYGIPQPGKNDNLVFSCKAGGRSRKAMNAAVGLGFTNTRHYIGGFMDWQEKTK